MTITPGLGFVVGVRPHLALSSGQTDSTAYTPLLFLKEMDPPQREIDGADAGLLAGLIDQETPTRPALTGSATMYVVEGDPGYQLVEASNKQFPVQYLDWKLTYPSGATKTFVGWAKNWKPSKLQAKENRTVDFDISVQSVPVYTPPQSS